MSLLVVRTGINWNVEDMSELKKSLEEKLPTNFILLILHGENENIETSFETVNLY